MTVAALQPRAASDRAVTGGTLRLYGPGDVDQLDPAAAQPGPASQLARLLSRQLVTYAGQPDLRRWQAVAPVPDVAMDVPSTYNAGLGASHRSYVFHLRSGVLWDTTPVRRVTAHDFVRGLKRMCNPVARSPGFGYFKSMVRGMGEFSAGFAAAVSGEHATSEQLAHYQNRHEIDGVFALDDDTLVIELVRPEPDFVHALALPCVSAAPVEYDAFLPDSPELGRNLRSNGPYRVAHHVPGRELRLEPNPAWRPEADPVRRRHVAEVVIGHDDVSPAGIAARIDAGEADLPWGPPTCAPPQPGAAAPRAAISYALAPYLVFNVARGAPALRDARVRRALAAAIDRTVVADVYRRLGAAADVRVAHGIVPPNNDAHTGATDALAYDPGRARAALARHAAGLTLTVMHRREGAESAAARAYAADLERAGVGVRLVGLDPGDYRRHLAQPAARGWDVTACSHAADWLPRNGRAFLQPLFEDGASANYGGYGDHEVDALIARAAQAAVEPASVAAAAWRAVERRMLEEAAVVPLAFQAPAVPAKRGRRVRGAFAIPAGGYLVDLGSVWLHDRETSG